MAPTCQALRYPWTMPDAASEPLTYSVYLRVPELLSLQSPVGYPSVHDELLFIDLQQAQELWFKQMLH
jgi:tryptophan 2,3-dioxygenase